MLVALMTSGSLLFAQAPPTGQAAQSAPVISDAVAVQVMLDRTGFSPGEIDGHAGMNLRRALEAFQRAHDLPVTGTADDATWKRLQERAGGQPPLVTYEISDADVAGPFTPDIPADLQEESRLSALDYRNPLERLAEMFHVSPSVLHDLNPGATFSRAGERITVTNIAAIDPLAPTPESKPRATIVVTKATSALTVEDDSGHVLLHAPVTTGSQHDPLPIGTWKVTGVQKNPVFHYNPALFWDANPSHSKATIPAGPNNPVGVVWINLTKEHYGIHGTPEPSRIGHTQSHGCVRLTNWDAMRVAQWARPGTVVRFQ